MDVLMMALLLLVGLGMGGFIVWQQGRKSKGPAKGAANAAERIRLAERIMAKRTGIVLSGRVVNGTVEFDQETLAAVSREFPGAEVSFVAVNAPFDPQSQVAAV